MLAIAELINVIVNIVIFLLIANAIMSWLVAFNVVNPSHPVTRQIGETLYRLTEPMLRPVRRFMPNLGGIDLSPVVVIIGLSFLRNLVVYDLLLGM